MENSGNVVEICNPEKKWTLAEANQIIPLLQYLSSRCDEGVKELLTEQRFLIRAGADKEKVNAIDVLVIKELNKYGTKLIKLGCVYLKGNVLFPTEDGKFFSWYPKEEIIQYYAYWNPIFGYYQRTPVNK